MKLPFSTMGLSVPALALLLTPAALKAEDGSVDPGPICTDRPTKSNAACTVPEGKLQIETDLLSWTRMATTAARSDVLAYASATVKYGIGPDSDLQIGIAPLVEVRTRSGGQAVSQQGFGDLTLRFKQRLTGPQSAVQIAVIPVVKAPTAKAGIGNGEWEGGVIVPVQVPVGKLTLTLAPQVNLLADALAPDERHLEFQGVANLAFPVAPRTTLAVEVWTSQNWDPAGTIRQYSADAALSYLINDELQIDMGGNFGLNRMTPDVQIYAGVSARF